MKYILKDADAANNVAAVTINYGNFINTVVQFLIIAFVIFLVIKGINSMKRAQPAEAPVAPAPSKEEAFVGRNPRFVEKQIIVCFFIKEQ